MGRMSIQFKKINLKIFLLNAIIKSNKYMEIKTYIKEPVLCKNKREKEEKCKL